jgi:hypothetical protein
VRGWGFKFKTQGLRVMIQGSGFRLGVQASELMPQGGTWFRGLGV